MIIVLFILMRHVKNYFDHNQLKQIQRYCLKKFRPIFQMSNIHKQDTNSQTKLIKS